MTDTSAQPEPRVQNGGRQSIQHQGQIAAIVHTQGGRSLTTVLHGETGGTPRWWPPSKRRDPPPCPHPRQRNLLRLHPHVALNNTASPGPVTNQVIGYIYGYPIFFFFFIYSKVNPNSVKGNNIFFLKIKRLTCSHSFSILLNTTSSAYAPPLGRNRTDSIREDTCF